MVNLDDVVKSLKKKYSSAIIGNELPMEYEFISTGNLAFDLLSDGGIPVGFVTEFLGLSQSGKSLFIHKIIANAQKKFDAVGVLVDRENSFFRKRAEETIGVDSSKLIIAPPSETPTVIDAFQFLIDFIESVREKDKDQYLVLAIDSISAFDKDTDLSKGDSGRKAKSTHEGLRAIIPHIDKKTVLIISNQVTYKIGVLFGDNTTTTSGESMKYYSTCRFALQDRKKIIDAKKGNEVVGAWLGVESIKTRLGPCYRKGFLPVFYNRGIDYYGGYIRLLVDRGYLEPKNKAEFNAFKQTTVVDKNKKQFNEFDVDSLVKEHPELLFTEYPEYCKET